MLNAMPNRLPLNLLVGVLAFFLGVSITTLRPKFRPTGRATSPWQSILSFENKDLSKLDGDSSRVLRQAIDGLTGKPNSSVIPRLFRRIPNSKGETRYILVEEAPLVMIPGKPRLRVHIFDLDGKLLSGADFAAGWRTILTDMQVMTVAEIGRAALVVSGQYCFGGHPSHQYYALVGERLVLFHLERDDQLERNNYRHSNGVIGPSIIAQSANDLENQLHSPDTAAVLSALTWLSGFHGNPRRPEPYGEDISQAQLFEALHSRASVHKALTQLSQSEKEWVRAAAKMSLEAKDSQ